MPKVKINNVRLEEAEGGVILSYDKKTEKDPKPGEDTNYSNCSYDYLREPFEKDDNESMDEMLERALKRFKELWLQNY